MVIFSGAHIYVKDLERMAAFYERTFMLDRKVVEADEIYELTDGEFILTLVVARPKTLSVMAMADPQGLREETPTGEMPVIRMSTPIKLTVDVDSLPVAKWAVVDNGGRAISNDWEWDGWVHSDIVDPEGNVVELRSETSVE